MLGFSVRFDEIIAFSKIQVFCYSVIQNGSQLNCNDQVITSRFLKLSCCSLSLVLSNCTKFVQLIMIRINIYWDNHNIYSTNSISNRSFTYFHNHKLANVSWHPLEREFNFDPTTLSLCYWSNIWIYFGFNNGESRIINYTSNYFNSLSKIKFKDNQAWKWNRFSRNQKFCLFRENNFKILFLTKIHRICNH